MASNDTAQRKPLLFAPPAIDESDAQAVLEVLRTGWITTGEQCRTFEEELADYLGVEHVVAISSCTTAEETCLAYLDLPAGSRVGVPTWTFVSTALAVERAGCKPVLIDVDADTLNISETALNAALETDLSAVVGVHYAGTPFTKAIRDACAERDVPLIEDAAHAFGSTDDRGLIAGQGTAGACYSFYATKNLTTGEGGAIATDNAELAAYARTYRLHGMTADAVDRYRVPGAYTYDVTVPGLKANMPDLLAALGRSQLARFPQSQAHRRDLVNAYRNNLADAALRFVPGEQHLGSADHLCAIDALTTEKRNGIIANLTEHSIGSSVHFRPLHTFSHYVNGNVEYGPGGLPVAEELNGRIMSLPLHVGMSIEDVDRVCAVVAESL